jgi:hypothetical protein
MRRSLSRRRMAILSMAVLAVMAMAASAASASAASPEFGSLGAKFPDKFTVSGSGLNVETPATGALGSCSKATGSGSITGHKSGTATLSFTGCSAMPKFCGSGEKGFKTAELETIPVYLNKAQSPHAVDVLFRPKVGNTFATLTCGGLPETGRLIGSVLATISPVNFLRSNYTVTFSQNVTSYETEAGGRANSWLELEYEGQKPERESWNSGGLGLVTESNIEIVG